MSLAVSPEFIYVTKDMLGETLYLVLYRPETCEYDPGSNSCQMCRKMIINSGLEKVVVRISDTEYQEINVEDWIENDDLISGKTTY